MADVFEATCSVGEGDHLIDHEFHRGGRLPRVKRLHALRFKIFSPCAIPGINLGDYSHNAQSKGWGPPCTGSRTTITLSNGTRLTVRTEIAELTKLIMDANIRQGYAYRAADTGAYNCRYISGTTVWSNHAWGLAIDENWQTNPFTSPVRTDRPAWEQVRWQRYGFALGINYTGKQDAMHNEFMGTPAQAAQATILARQELGGSAPPPPPPPPPSTPWLNIPTVSYGMRVNPTVVSLQKFLNAYGWRPALPLLPPTGNYLDQTKSVVAAAQRQMGITGADADGSTVGPRTKKALWDRGWRG
jgi:hypothetical protein